MQTYFTLYESRHSGWIVTKITGKQAKKIAEDPDNTEVFPCVTNDQVKFDIPIDISNAMDVEAWKINEVSCKIANNKLFIYNT